MLNVRSTAYGKLAALKVSSTLRVGNQHHHIVPGHGGASV